MEAMPQLAVSESEELPPVDALVCDALAVLAQPDLLEPVADLAGTPLNSLFQTEILASCSERTYTYLLVSARPLVQAIVLS